MNEDDYDNELNVPLSSAFDKWMTESLDRFGNEDFCGTSNSILAKLIIEKNKDVVIKDYEHLRDLVDDFVEKAQDSAERSQNDLLLEVWSSFLYKVEIDYVVEVIFEWLSEDEDE